MIGQFAVMPEGDYGYFCSFGGMISVLIKGKNRRNLGMFMNVFGVMIKRAKTSLFFFS